MKTLIAGRGEVGVALGEVLACYAPRFVDTDEFKNDVILYDEKFDIIHIAFPYGEKFEESVNALRDRFQPKEIVIHSTVPVGTSRKLGATHSPIRGIHPDLNASLYAFIKYIGGEGGSRVANYFRRAGMKVCLFDTQEATEALKLFDTEYYRVCVEFAHRVKRYCDAHGLNYSEVYRLPNITYNESYKRLNHEEFVRPVLEPIMGAIGGHCVMPNKELIALSE